MFLEKYLDDFYYDMVIANYDYSYLEGLDENNFKEIYKLLKELRNLGFNDILVYTGYSFKEVSKKYENILSLIDVLIDEPYIESLNNNVGLMGSDNQNIRILNPLLKEEYKNLRTIKRSRQNFISNNKIISVGIPNKICSR